MKPSRKWAYRTVVSVSGLAVEVATTGAWSVADTVMTITVVTAALTSYILPNEKEGSA